MLAAYRTLKRISEIVFRAIVYASMIFIPVILCAQVIGRKFLRSPILGAEELAGFAFTAMVLFGSVLVCYRNTHIVVDVFVKQLRGSPRKAARIIADLLTLGCYALLIYCFYAAIPTQRKFFSGIFRIPKSVYAYALIIAFVFMTASMIEKIIVDIKSSENE